MGRFLNIISQASDLNGVSINGAKLKFFVAGQSSTLLDTFKEESLDNANTNPVIADGQGRFGDIWLDPTRKYFVEYRDANDNLLDSWDNVFSLSETEVSIGYKPNLAVFIGGVPENNELLIKFVATSTYVFPEDLPNSQADAEIAPTADTVFSFKKNGSTVGTATFLAGNTTGTYVWASDVVLNIGDKLTIVSQPSADATIAGISFTLQTEQVTGAVNSTYSADFYVDTGSANAHILSPTGSTVSPESLEEGYHLAYRTNAANTGAVTINPDGLGPIPLTDINGNALTNGAISADQYIEARYDNSTVSFYAINDSASNVSQNIGIGDFYFTSVAANPATTLNYGTWIAVAEGLFVVGIGSGTDANAVVRAFTAGQTSGEYEHELTSGENGPHTHTGNMREDGGNSANEPERGSGSLSGAFTTSSSGSGTAHENTPPGFGMFIWERTA